MALAALVLMGGMLATVFLRGPTASTTARASVATADPVVAAAGDITSGSGSSGAFATSDLLVANPPTRVLALGDLVYPEGQESGFTNGYDRSWGRVKSITSPVAGNHDQDLPLAQQYYWTYFGPQAGAQGKGWYSFDLGSWHVIALNSGCASSSSRPNSPACDATSEQAQWLAADLAAHPSSCVLAYWHHPRFSSGPHGNNATVQSFWDTLYAAGADVVLGGHEHLYERFAPQSATGSSDPSGIRQFTVGTGGVGLYSFGSPKPNSEVRYNGGFGVLELTLRSASYEWEFVSVAGNTFTDSGSGGCGSDTAPPETTITSGPTGVARSANASFTFSSSEAGSTFECRLDSQGFEPCSSPKEYSTLARGEHTFAVRATDPAGNTDATAATRTWIADPGYPRPLAGAILRVPLVPAFKPCVAGDRTHAPPLEAPSCADPEQESAFLTVGAPGAPRSVGLAKFTVQPGNPATPEDEADVALAVSVTDVRGKSNLVDYAGELQADLTLRITDSHNGGSNAESGTVEDLAYQFTVACTPTLHDAQTGSTCDVSTTADSVVPGSVPEGKRSVWEFGKIRVFDGGHDGLAATTGNTLFEVQGVFVP